MGEERAHKVGTDLTEGNILRQMMLYVFPLLAANIVQQLYNTVDMIVIGKFVGSTGTVGVSSGGEIAGVITMMASSFGAATQIYISQLYGAKNREAISKIVMTSLSFIAILAAASMILCVALADVFLGWLKVPAEAFGQAHMYMTIVSLGMPFIFGYNVVCGILRGMGESKRPLIFVSVAAVANVLMDILFVWLIPLEAAGTAIATVASQAASFIAAFRYLYKRRAAFDIEFTRSNFKIDPHHLKVIVTLGIPLTAQTALIHLTMLFCSARINEFGLIASATNSIGNKVQRLVNIFCSSINQGAGAMTGQNIGARKFDRVKKIVYTALATSSVMAFTAILIAVFFPRQAFGIFTSDPEVLEFGVLFMRISIVLFIISPFQGAFGAVVHGSGNAKLNFFIGMLDGVVLRLGLSFLFAYAMDMGVVGFFLGNILARLSPTLIGMWYFFSNRWQRRKLLGT